MSFGIDGNEYEIDLNEAHVHELLDAMKRYLQPPVSPAAGAYPHVDLSATLTRRPFGVGHTERYPSQFL
jgi:hypothetical protein